MAIQLNSELEEKGLIKINLRKRLNRLRSILQNEPDNLELKLSILRCLLFLRRFDEANKESMKVLETSPDNPIALWVLGIIYYYQSNFEKSEEYLRKVVRLLPEFMVAHIELATALISQYKVDEGIQELNKGIQLNPFYWRAHLNLCSAYLMQYKIKDGFNEAKLAWKYRKSFRTFTNLITTYDRASKLWSIYMAIAFNLIAVIFPSHYTIPFIILGTGRLSISAFGLLLYSKNKSAGFITFVWLFAWILFFILRYLKV